MRWSDLTIPWQEAFSEGWKAGCAGSIPIGAVITGGDDQIIARGRNHIHDDQANPTDITLHTLAHAEINAILSLRDPQVDLHTCTIYTTVEPCPLCMGAIYMSGIRKIRFASRDPHAGSINLLGLTPYFSLKPVLAFGAGIGEENEKRFEAIIVALQAIYFMQKIAPDRISRFLNLIEESAPAGMAAARNLLKNDILKSWKNNPLAAQKIFETIDHAIDSIEATLPA